MAAEGVSVVPEMSRTRLVGLALIAGLAIKLSIVLSGVFTPFFAPVVIAYALVGGAVIWKVVIYDRSAGW